MVSVLLATMGRLNMAAACVRSIQATTEGVEIIAAVDGPLEDANRLDQIGCIVWHSEQPRGSSRAWNDALSLSTGDPVVLAADDLEFLPGWLAASLKCLDTFPDGWGFVGFNDGHWNGDADFSTHYLMSRRFIVEVLGGVIAWDCYKHSFNDREICDRARRAGRYAWCRDAHVLHRHWIFGDRELDTTDARMLALHTLSETTYLQRVAAGFPNNYEPIIKK